MSPRNEEDGSLQSKKNDMDKSEQRRWWCYPCKLQFLQKWLLTKHLQTVKCKQNRRAAGENVEIEGDYRCPTCPKRFAKLRSLKHHLKSNLCPKTKDLDDQLEDQSKTVDEGVHKRKGFFKCVPCGVEVPFKGALNRHLRTRECKQNRRAAGEDVLIEGDYKCLSCPKRFFRSCSLKQHLKGNKCPKTQDRNDEAEHATKGEDEEKDKPKGKFECIPCEKSFVKKQHYCQHLTSLKCMGNRKAAGENVKVKGNFKCRNCSKRFADNRTLKLHLENHCPTIKEPNGQTENQSESEDEKMHKPRKTYDCIPCGAKYLLEGRLNTHLKSIDCKRNRNAAGENVKIEGDHKCPTCSKTYVKEINLKIHLEGNKCQKSKDQNEERECDTEGEDEEMDTTVDGGSLEVQVEVPIQTETDPNEDREGDTEGEDEEKSTTVDGGSLEAQVEVPIQTETDPYEEREGDTEGEDEEMDQTPKEYKCIPCGATFLLQGQLNKHLKNIKCKLNRKAAGENVKVEGDYRCPTCPKTYLREIDLKIHLEGNKCPITIDPSAQNDPSESDHEEGSCSAKRRKVGEHLRLNKSRRNNDKFEKCSKNFGQRANAKPTVGGGKSLKLLVEVPEDEENYRCGKCNFTCIWKSNFVRHMKSHVIYHEKHKEIKERGILNLQLSTERIFPCRWCDAMFSSQLEMIAEMENSHDKTIPKDKLALPPQPRLQLCENSNPLHCCYICLRSYPKLNGAYDCVFLCERRIGLSTDGFCCPSFR